MRILLCLLSEQHIPNLLSVHHFQPDHLVLVETKGMRDRKFGDFFLKALQAGGLDYADRCERVPLAHEESLPETVRALKAVFGRHPSEDWIVNVTGGTKPMSIAAYQFFHALEITPVYINFREPNRVQWMDGSRAETCDYRPRIAEFLAGYGFESRKPPDKVSEAESRAGPWWDCARVLATHALPGDLLRFGDAEEGRKARDRARNKGFVLERRYLSPEVLASEALRRSLEETFGINRADGDALGRLDKYQAQFLMGGWLEVYLWGLLTSHQDELSMWDVRLGLEPAHMGSGVPNDFDVAFMHNYGLWMVECKSGAQENDPGGDILYKVEAIIRQFRAIHVRTVLATTSDNILDGTSGEIRPAIRNRAKVYRCAILAREQVRALATAESPAPLLAELLGL